MVAETPVIQHPTSSVMKNKYRILKIAVTVIILGFLLSFSLRRFNDKSMEKVSVNMVKTKSPVYFIDEKDIKEIVKKSNPTKRIGDINIPELEKKLNQLPAVDSANVYLNLNGNLNLDIKQRVPAFRLNKNEKDFYVDDPTVVVGAGTVLDAVTARLAIESGADFIVSPAFDAEVAVMCNLYQIPYMPGCMTIT